MRKTVKNFGPRPFSTMVMVLLLILLAPAVGAESNGEADIPDNLRADLEAVLKAKLAELVAEKNEDGLPYKRGAFSKSFRKVDDTTYHATFNRDTVKTGSVLTERLLLTLRKQNGKWAIAEEKVEETFTGLHREVRGDEKFHRFETFALDKEGMKVRASNGSLFVDYFLGEPWAIVLVADKLSYRFEPPPEATSQYYSVYGYYKDKAKDDLEFEPHHASMLCDPTTCNEILESACGGLTEISRGEADAALRSLYEAIGNRRREALKQNPFAGVERPFEEDRRGFLLSLNKKGDDFALAFLHHDFKLPEITDHNIWLIVDSYAPKEVQFFVTRLQDDDVWYGPLLWYYSEDTRAAGVDPYQLEYRRDYMLSLPGKLPRRRDFEVETVKGEIEMALEDAELLSGDVTVRLKALEDVETAPFFIARERRTEEERQELRNPTMYVNSIQDGEGRELTWVKDSPFTGLVVLPETVKAGETFTLRMQFQSRGSITKLNPSFSYVDRGGWLPFVSFADIINEFDLSISVPDRYTTLGVGEKVSEEVKGGVNTTRWVTKQPVMFPSVTFGDYITATPRFEAKKMDGTVIPITVYVDKVSTNILDFDVTTQREAREQQEAWQSGARGIRGRSMRAIAEQAANSINLYREIFGVDYPYARLDLVADPYLSMFYGQAPSSLIYLGAFVFRGEGEMVTLTGAAQISKFLKSVVAHEVGHQWWGSSTVNASTNNYWFVESLAEFASALYLEAVYGPKEYQEQVDEWRHNVLDRDMTVSVQDARNLATPDINYYAAVYNKGPYAFHTLRMTFGDEKLYAFLKALGQELKGKEIVTRDIQRVAEKVYGGNMEWFFDQWLRGVAIPEYELDYATRRTEDGNWLVQGTVKQKVVIGNQRAPIQDQYYRGVVPVTVTFRKGKQEAVHKQIFVEGPESKFAFKVPKEPLEVAFNKYGAVLSHDVKVISE